MANGAAELPLTQEGGEPPAVLAAGGTPGEHGFAVFKFRFRGGAHLGATSPRRHLVWFQLSNVFIECRRATRIFREAFPEVRLLSALPASTALLTRDRARMQFWSRLSPLSSLSQPQKIQPSVRS